MGTAGAAESATVGMLLRGHWYDAVLALLDEAVRDEGPMRPEPDEGPASTGSAPFRWLT